MIERNTLEPSHFSDYFVEDKAVLTPYEFLADLRLEARQATKKVVAQTMSIEVDEFAGALLSIYQEMPEGVKKVLYIDSYSNLVIEEGIYEINRRLPGFKRRAQQLYEKKQEMFEEFAKAGVRIIFTNPPRSRLDRWLPISGRNHLKGAGVDERVFYLGGLNLEATNAGLVEFMVKFTGDLANKLNEQFDRIHNQDVQTDFQEQLQNDTWLLFDAGKPGESIILDMAVDLINHAKISVENTSGFVPDGIIAQALRRAKERGVRTEIITYSPPFEQPLPVNMDNLVWLGDRINRIKSILTQIGVPLLENPFRGIHAKLLIIDHRLVMFGTHNLAEAGVKVGTQEMSIISIDPKLIDNLYTSYIDYRYEARPDLISMVF